MRDAAWNEFVGIRDEQRWTFASMLAEYLAGDQSDLVVGQVSGAARMLAALPYSHGISDEVRRALPAAHRANKAAGRPCGCGKYKRCVIEGIDPTGLAERLAGEERDEEYEEDLEDQPERAPWGGRVLDLARRDTPVPGERLPSE